VSAPQSAPGGPRAARHSPPPPPAYNPVSGVSCPVLTRAIREVEAEMLVGLEPAERDKVTQLLAATGLAVGKRTPVFVVELSPRHPPALTRRVIDALRFALLRAWSRGPVPTPGSRVLGHLLAIEQLAAALENDGAQQFGAHLAGPDAADLLAEVVHDLRSPLTSILFLAEALEQERSGPLTDLQRRQLRLVYTAALRLHGVVTDAIEVAVGGAVLGSDDPAPLSLTELFDGVRDIVRPIAEEKGLTIRCETPVGDYRIGNRLTLQRVLLNLVTNALKFTHHGGVEITAEERAPGRVRFSVRDSGPGIAAAAVATLYRPFRRAPAGQGYRFSSTGLGLVVSRRLVAAMGAELQYESIPDAGTRFWFELDLPPTDPD
jgi:signal transduction histidine kinase